MAVPPDHPREAHSRFVNYEALVGHGRSRLRREALAVAAAALAAADPASALRRSLTIQGDTLYVTDPQTGERTSFSLRDRHVFVVGAGKASLGIAQFLDELLGPRITDGAVAVKRGQRPSAPLHYIEVIEAAHPIPDEQSLRAGLRLLGIAEQAQPSDLLIATVTGGSSALAVAPANGISLEDTVATNRILLASGADIVAVNAVRKHLSRIKGGFLAATAGCSVLNLSVSDVVGDPPDAFTDLTVPDRSTFATAQDVCTRFALWDTLPASVSARLRAADPRQETPKPGAFPTNRITTVVLANSELMCQAAVDEARRLGYSARLLSLNVEGEAAATGRDLARRIAEEPPGTALIAGGENTVKLTEPDLQRAAGGPNQEVALAAAAEAPATSPSWCVLSLDSDGSDGPTAAAGGLVDDLTAREGGERGVDMRAALAAHTSHTALAALDCLVITGPTGTNVNDLKVALRGT